MQTYTYMQTFVYLFHILCLYNINNFYIEKIYSYHENLWEFTENMCRGEWKKQRRKDRKNK